jgi:hypothetical protein
MSDSSDDRLAVAGWRPIVLFVAISIAATLLLTFVNRERRASQLADFKADVCATVVPAAVLENLRTIAANPTEAPGQQFAQDLAALFPAADRVQVIFEATGEVWATSAYGYGRPAPRGRRELPRAGDWEALSEPEACSAFQTDDEFVAAKSLTAPSGGRMLALAHRGKRG